MDSDREYNNIPAAAINDRRPARGLINRTMHKMLGKIADATTASYYQTDFTTIAASVESSTATSGFGIDLTAAGWESPSPSLALPVPVSSAALPPATIDFTGPPNGDLGNVYNWTDPNLQPPNNHRLPNSGDIVVMGFGTYSGNGVANLWYYGQLTGMVSANAVHSVQADGGTVTATTAYNSGAKYGGRLGVTTAYGADVSTGGTVTAATIVLSSTSQGDFSIAASGAGAVITTSKIVQNVSAIGEIQISAGAVVSTGSIASAGTMPVANGWEGVDVSISGAGSQLIASSVTNVGIYISDGAMATIGSDTEKDISVYGTGSQFVYGSSTLQLGSSDRFSVGGGASQSFATLVAYGHYNPSIAVESGGTLVVQSLTSGNASVQVGGAGTLSGQTVSLAGDVGIRGSDSMIFADGGVLNALLIIDQGGTFASNGIALGSVPETANFIEADVFVSAPGSSFVVNQGTASIGDAAISQIAVYSGATFNAAAAQLLVIGNSAKSNGSIFTEGTKTFPNQPGNGAAIVSVGTVQVGVHGRGSLDVGPGGTFALAGPLTIGVSGGGSGSVGIGAGAQASDTAPASQGIILGANGTDSIGGIDIGTSFAVSGYVTDGQSGRGSVFVYGSTGHFALGSLAVGVSAGAYGSFHVAEGGATAVVTGDTAVTIGDAGGGALTVNLGGTFSASAAGVDLLLAAQQTGSGSIYVGGTASLLQLPGDLSIAGSTTAGYGHVEVTSSGLVTVGGDVVLGGAMVPADNDAGEPNGSCGDWSYGSGGQGALRVQANGEVQLTGGAATLTLADLALTILDVAPSAGPGSEIRLTVDSTAVFDAVYAGSDTIAVDGVRGVADANGIWNFTVVDDTHIDLDGSAFDGAYAGGGAVIPEAVAIASGGFVEVGGQSGAAGGGAALQIDAGGLVVGHGLIETGVPGTPGTIVDNGGAGAGFEAQDGVLVIDGNVGGGGNATIDDNATLELRGAFNGTVSFNGGYETTLKLDDPAQFTGMLAGLAVGDTIEFAATAVPPDDLAHTEIVGGTLVVTMSDGTTLNFGLTGDYANDCFTIRTLPDGDAALTLEPASASVTTGVAGSGYGNPYIDSLIWGWGAWNPQNGPITYWFGTQADVQGVLPLHGETQALTCDSTVDNWTAQEQDDFLQALQDYASVCGLTFQQASSATTANIVWWLDPNALGDGLLGLSEVPAQVPDGQLWQYFNDTPWTEDPNQLSFGGDGNDTIVHELGHTLGMAHPFDGGAEPDSSNFPGIPVGADPFTSLGTDEQNQNAFTIMSYTEGWTGAPPFPPGPDYGTQGALGAFDIAAMQTLYGANDAYNAGDDTYNLPQANAPGTGWSCIWDGGGVNTISNAGSNLNCTIDLQAAPLIGADAGGFVSWAYAGTPFAADYVPIQGGYTIAAGVVIQDAIGGNGNDLLIGGANPNVAYTFTGGGGDDRIIGGAGNNNTAVYSGPQSAYALVQNGDGSWTITDQRPGSPDGTDTLQNIQDVKFADDLFILPLTGPSIAIYPIDQDDVLTAAGRQSPLTIDGIASVAGQVQVTFAGKSYTGTVDVNGGWSVTVPTTDLSGAVLHAGTYDVTAGIQDQIGNTAETTERLTVLGPGLPPPGDFNGDGISDILWRSTGGNVAIWQMSGGSLASSAIAGFANPSAWTIRGTGDFDGDGRADILWQSSGGNVDIWDMQGTSVAVSGLAGFADPASWHIEATGDFSGDGRADILWQDTAGDVALWQMDGTSVAASSIFGFADPAAWHIRGAGDFNGDGKADILWQDQKGNVAVWEMNGSTVAASGIVGFADPANWHIRGTGDFNGDGKSDILWQDNTGDVAIWEMNGLSVAATGLVGFADPTAWRVADIGDYNGDGRADILWQSTGGNIALWQMNGLSIAASGLIGFADPSAWHIVPPDNTGSIPGMG